MFATSITGWLCAVDEATGELLWKGDLDRQRKRWENAATTAADGVVHVGSTGYSAAFDEKTGRKLWELRHTTSGDWSPSAYSSPAISGDVIYVGGRAGRRPAGLSCGRCAG